MSIASMVAKFFIFCCCIFGLVYADINPKSPPLLTGGPTIQKIDSGKATYPDGLCYSGADQELAFVDRNCDYEYAFDTINGTLTNHTVPGTEGEVLAFYKAEVTKQKYVAGSNAQLREVTVNSETNRTSKLLATITTDLGYIINKAHTDRKGILFLTVNPSHDTKHLKGRFYKYSSGKVTLVHDCVTSLGDFAWTGDGKKMYLVSNCSTCIESFDYDSSKEVISNKQPVYHLPNDEVLMNYRIAAMTIDTDNNLWIALSEGGCIHKIDTKTGKCVVSIKMPSKQLTSITFGGLVYSGLFVGSGDACHTPVNKDAGIYYVSGINSNGYPGMPIVI